MHLNGHQKECIAIQHKLIKLVKRIENMRGSVIKTDTCIEEIKKDMDERKTGHVTSRENRRECGGTREEHGNNTWKSKLILYHHWTWQMYTLKCETDFKNKKVYIAQSLGYNTVIFVRKIKWCNIRIRKDWLHWPMCYTQVTVTRSLSWRYMNLL